MSFLSKLFHREIVPTKARLEACTLCQLNCKTCFMRLEDNCVFGAGYLKFNDFVKFTKLNPYIKEIELANVGEIFLNPELAQIIKYAYEHNIKLTAGSGVNFNNVSDEMLEFLVKYQFEYIVLSIDGWNQDSYVKYRRNGNFDKVIENIRKLNSLKNKLSSQKPFLIWKYIIFEHNDNIIGAKRAQDLAKELDMDFFFAKDWSGYTPKNIVVSDKNTDVAVKYINWGSPCPQLWNAPQINWDGHFLGCCMNHEHFYGGGNLFEIPLKKYLRKQLIRNTKMMLMGKNIKKNENWLCKECIFYKDMKDSGTFISKADLLET